MTRDHRLLIGTDIPAVTLLAEALSAERMLLPEQLSVDGEAGGDWPWSDRIEQWRQSALARAPCSHIVVAVWQNSPAPKALVETDLQRWVQRSEAPLAGWMVALDCARHLCADGGSIVAVVETPARLDSEDWAPERAVAEAVAALARSLARSEGARGVRVNAVATPGRSAPAEPIGPAPSLSTFPGRIEREVSGAVRALLDDNACGVTGAMLDADCGRSW